MRASLSLLLPAATLFFAAPPAKAAEAAAAADMCRRLCLDNAATAEAARSAAAGLGFEKRQTLPGLAGGADIETYADGEWELAIRENKSGRFSCILMFAPAAAAANAAVAEAVGAIERLTVKSSKGNDRQWRAKWTPTQAPKGSEVVLTIHDGIGRRIAILTLESKGSR